MILEAALGAFTAITLGSLAFAHAALKRIAADDAEADADPRKALLLRQQEEWKERKASAICVGQEKAAGMQVIAIEEALAKLAADERERALHPTPEPANVAPDRAFVRGARADLRRRAKA